ncbi:MAG: hypothetical protein IPK19_28385 [Chloroflexi bacterium]|nr:hypothetical protein [Chloroflexota bacterium]
MSRSLIKAIQPVGSSELACGGQEEFSLAENRAGILANAARGTGRFERAIDRLMRHVTQGEHLSSDSGDSPLALALEVVNGMNAELARLGWNRCGGIVA